MKCVLWLLLAAAVPMAAQIGGLATTDDGAVLYFSSVLRLEGTEQFSHEKIFRLEGGEFELLAQVEREQVTNTLSNFFRLGSPSVSGDGRVVSYVGRLDCIGGSRCTHITEELSTIESPDLDEPLILPGFVRLSRNGQYALQAGASGADIVRNRIDLVTGEVIVLNGAIQGVAGVTSDGRIVATTINGPALWTTEGLTVLPIQGEHLGSVSINDQGTHVIYQSFPPWELHSLELATGTDTLLSDENVDFFGHSISNDGRLVLYVPRTREKGAENVTLAESQAFLINADGTDRRQLTDVPEGVTHAVLSGDGSVAYVVTFSGRLLHIDIATNAIEELIPRTPFISAIHGGAAPGSLSFIEGTGLSETVAVADAPLPESLDGVDVRLGGELTRILLVAPHDVRFQVPFEVEPGDYAVKLPGPESAFEQAPYVVTVSDQNPRVIRNGAEVVAPGLGDLRPVIVNLDFSALITEENPARPSDIISFYMTGLGLTQPMAATGELTPVGPLLLPSTPIECSWLGPDGRGPVETFFTGLAPGMIGVYQVTVRLPPDPPPFEVEPLRSAVSMRCGPPGGPTDFATVPVRLDP